MHISGSHMRLNVNAAKIIVRTSITYVYLSCIDVRNIMQVNMVQIATIIKFS